NPVDPRCAGEYARFRRVMTQEANAAIEGAFAGGAREVLVNDSHWTMRNLLAEELDPRAELLSGGPKTWSMMEGIERGWDCCACIGYHARAGTANAILDHTYTSGIHDVRLNGASVGELGLNAALAGCFRVPVVLVSGDQALAAECHALLGDQVRTVVVKEAQRRAVRGAGCGAAPHPGRHAGSCGTGQPLAAIRPRLAGHPGGGLEPHGAGGPRGDGVWLRAQRAAHRDLPARRLSRGLPRLPDDVQSRGGLAIGRRRLPRAPLHPTIHTTRLEAGC